MKYRDLLQFEPVIDVIQLRQADEKSRAEKLVSTYVISDRMMEVILHRILPSLRVDGTQPGDGLFVVGNYGTGKSHLMSLVTAVAEHADLVKKITHPGVAEGLKPIAGKFKVVRQETGASEQHLRDVILNDLQKQLARMGVDVDVPAIDQVSNNKDLLLEIMKRFDAVYPGYGLLIAMDELLDFLRARQDRQLVMDLNFLREIGEVCEITPLRFMAGIQESLFESPRFQFAADSIRRVKARFEQVRIVREDMAYVISQRLLAKSDKQRKDIRAHLARFTKLYTAMAEHLDNYVDLFPVHPAYLEVFEQVTVIEKRDLLKALSKQMERLLDNDVPIAQPGLIAFDSYWKILNDEPAYRTIPEIRDVQDKARVLTERIRLAPGIKEYRDAALRIIDALSVHRLTLSDLYSPIGMTPIELRDSLCLHLPIPEADADFLLATVESTLREISRTVSGQFISHNTENDQYFLDLKKDIDFDALIEQRATSLDANDLDRYYFDLLARGLECTDSSYVPGFRIWERELPWMGQGVTRRGYIFLGAPNQRSTAHPERDFYLHFLAPYNWSEKDALNNPDEVYFILEQRDEKFEELLRRYAGAREMSAITSGSNKEQYDRKADQALRFTNNWLRENLIHSFKIIYQVDAYTVAEAIAKHRLSVRDLSLRDQVYRLSAAFLADHFQQKYPQYPRFSGIDFTTETISQAAEACLRAIAGGSATRPVQAALEGLKLGSFENGEMVFTIDESPFARTIIERLNALDEGHVLNKADLMGGEPGAETDVAFKLEPEWFFVVLFALVRQGEITINLPGRRVDVNDLEDVSRLGLDFLRKFTAIGRPKPMPEQALRELLSGLGLNPDSISQPDLAVEQLQASLNHDIDQTVRLLENLREGLRYWRELLFTPVEIQDMRTQLDDYRKFLSGLQYLNSPGRLRNLTQSVSEIRRSLRARKLIDELIRLLETLQTLQPLLDYIYQAQVNLPDNDDWNQESERVRREQIEALRDSAQRNQSALLGRLKGGLSNLQDSYIPAYLKLHQKARLDTTQDARKKRLTSDAKWAQLRFLAQIEFLPGRQLSELEFRLSGIRSCPGLTNADLRTHAACPHCGYVPRSEQTDSAVGKLEEVETRFTEIYSQWTEALLTNLNSPTSQENLPLLGAKEREAVHEFLKAEKLPDKTTGSFLNGLRDTLQGLEKVTVDGTDFLLALTRPGMPCTPEDLQARFRDYIAEHTKGKDPNKVRIQIDW